MQKKNGQHSPLYHSIWGDVTLGDFRLSIEILCFHKFSIWKVVLPQFFNSESCGSTFFFNIHILKLVEEQIFNLKICGRTIFWNYTCFQKLPYWLNSRLCHSRPSLVVNFSWDEKRDLSLELLHAHSVAHCSEIHLLCKVAPKHWSAGRPNDHRGCAGQFEGMWKLVGSTIIQSLLTHMWVSTRDLAWAATWSQCQNSTWTLIHFCFSLLTHMFNHLSKSLAGTNWHRQTQFYSHFPWIASPDQGQKQTACVGRLASGLTGEGWHGAWLDGWRFDGACSWEVKKAS